MDTSEPPTAQETTAAVRDELCSSLVKLEKLAELSDLTVLCGSRTFKAHKAVLCPRSTWFEAACRKGAFKEGEENVITIEATSGGLDPDNIGKDNEDAVAHMMHYFYRLEYVHEMKRITADADASDPQDVEMPRKDSKRARIEANIVHKISDDDRSLTTHAHIFSTAIKYGVTGLQLLSWRTFGYHLNKIATDDVSTSDLAEAVVVVFTATPPSENRLKDLVTNILLKTSPALLEIPEIAAAIQAVDGLGVRLLLQSYTVYKGPLQNVCGHVTTLTCIQCHSCIVACREDKHKCLMTRTKYGSVCQACMRKGIAAIRALEAEATSDCPPQ